MVHRYELVSVKKLINPVSGNSLNDGEGAENKAVLTAAKTSRAKVKKAAADEEE